MDWTYNKLWISTATGNTEDISELSKLVEELIDEDDKCPLTFFNHIPIPDCLIHTNGEECPEVEASNENECGYAYLHEFTLKEWGSAFDADDVKGTWTDDEVAFYEFRTLSNAPLAWLQSISELYPNLIFEIDCTNELDLWESFSAIYINGKQVSYTHDKQ